jgi:hypothetical protein
MAERIAVHLALDADLLAALEELAQDDDRELAELIEELLLEATRDRA